MTMYRHYDKFLEPGRIIDLGGTKLKWYDLAPVDQPVPEEIADLARAFLEREASEGKLDPLGELGFVILHRCGESFYFLLVNTWKNENELWETVYAKTGVEDLDFAEFPFEDRHHATFCVWELAAVWHEQQAWKRFLLSQRDEAVKTAYLNDLYRGPA
jgi:DNA-binding transcriptional ArsR family regulator